MEKVFKNLLQRMGIFTNLYQNKQSKTPIIKRFAHLLLFLFCMCSINLTGCATVSDIGNSVSEMGSNFADKFNEGGGRFQMSVAGGITYFNNAKIFLGDLRVNVAANRPLNQDDPIPTALFMPLGLVQSSVDHLPISYGVSRILWQQFLSEQTFNVLELASAPPPYRVDHAIPMAHAMGANYLVGGYITHFYDGGSSDDSKIAIQLEVYDVASGALLWSIDQTGVLPYQTKKDNVLFTVQNRMPVDSMSTLIAALGKNIAMYLHYWTDPEGAKELDKQRKSGNKEGGMFEPSAFGRY